MRTIGLIGGMSCESTAVYYETLNRLVRARLGGLHSADLLLRSVDFEEIAAHQRAGDWDAAGARLAAEARRLQDAGAELVLLLTNTMHQVADRIEAVLDVPFVHIVDATAARLGEHKTVALLGTAYTMELPFYAERMAAHGVDVLVPSAEDRAEVHRVVYEELCLGDVRDASRARIAEIVAHLADRGATAVILGCTEITLLIGPDDVVLPTFDSTAIHAAAAVDLSLT